MRSTGLVIVMAGAAVACGACSSSSSSAGTSSPGEDSGVIGCGGDPRAQTYSAGMGQMGTSKVFKFELVSATPAPETPDPPTEIWVVRILDTTGKPVTDATFPSTPSTPNPRPWMPEHGHGTSEVTVTNNHDGTYTFDPMYLYMAGLWETDIVVESGGSTDSTKFFFCLQ